jgi:DNA-binding transcriptional ArsR family regulator
MNSEETWMPEIDRVVHEPARLAILTVLASCERADFLFLEHATGLTRGNLSVQLSRLEEAGLIELWKTVERKRTLTTAALTDQGRKNLASYWAAMELLRAAAGSLSKNVANATKSEHLFPGRLAPAPD